MTTTSYETNHSRGGIRHASLSTDTESTQAASCRWQESRCSSTSSTTSQPFALSITLTLSPTQSSPAHFEEWAESYHRPNLHFSFTIVNDQSTDEANRLGAIGDMHLVLTKHEIDDDIIVIGGDNLFSDDLSGFGDYCEQKKAPVTGVYDVGDLEQIKKYNSIEIDEDHRIIYFEEKPQVPKSTLTGIALYYYPTYGAAVDSPVHLRGKQSGPTRPAGPMALSACTLLRLEGAGPLVRRRFDRNSGRGKSRFSATIDRMFQDCKIESCKS